MNNFNEKLNSQNNNFNNNLLKNLTHENFINMASTIDNITLNGTNLDEINIESNNKNTPSPSYNDNKYTDKNFIKSLTKEIINNIRENDISVYDNLTNRQNDNIDNIDIIDEDKLDVPILPKKKNKNSKENFKKSIETMINTNNTSTIVSWFFDECFNVKDFILLFSIYFILSQDMIKDFFGKYFTSLNPNNDGTVDVKGVIIYGLILTVLFMVLKKFI
jgi:hypothetical protein